MDTIVRGCGTRIKGGIYAEVGLSGNGVAIETMLVDPPTQVSPETYGLSKIGVRIIEVAGVYHIMDWIGEKFYPSAPDFIEEVRRFGLSRRLPNSKDLLKLTKDSKIFLIHSKATLQNFVEVKAKAEDFKCMCEKDGHENLTSNCISLLYESTFKEGLELTEKGLIRRMPSFSYVLKKNNVQKKYGHVPSIFLAMPINNLAVIKDDVAGTHVDVYENIKDSGLDVEVKDS